MKETMILTNFYIYEIAFSWWSQGILKGEVSLYH